MDALTHRNTLDDYQERAKRLPAARAAPPGACSKKLVPENPWEDTSPRWN
ncbi:hypothetical protein [Streptomyces lannensis]|uniref:Uncharacterized protein n=1 Tax=Streptomyces lannensis TaxID=766498 RepID=A0ABP7LGS0_9ACTN